MNLELARALIFKLYPSSENKALKCQDDENERNSPELAVEVGILPLEIKISKTLEEKI